MNTNQKRLATVVVALFFWTSPAAAGDIAADRQADTNTTAERSSVEMASKAASDAASEAIESIARESADDLDVRVKDLKLTISRAAPVTIAAN